MEVIVFLIFIIGSYFSPNRQRIFCHRHTDVFLLCARHIGLNHNVRFILNDVHLGFAPLEQNRHVRCVQHPGHVSEITEKVVHRRPQSDICHF